MEKVLLYGMDLNQIQNVLSDYPAYRAKQLYDYLYHHRSSHVTSFSDCSVLPTTLRQELDEKYFLSSLNMLDQIEDTGGSKKFSFKLIDENVIESVAICSKDKRVTACISSQVGCKMGCAFCQTATLGFKRNLSSGEILEQISIIESQVGLLDNIVFMGMGEPLDNLDSLLQAIFILTDPAGFNFGQRRITISTSGIVSQIERLSNLKKQIRLAVSLNSSLQEKRIRIMPVAKANPLDKLHAALKAYQASTNFKRITLEYVALDEFNLFKEDIDGLVEFCKGLNVLINVIPFNPGGGLPFKRPGDKKVMSFVAKLKDRGLNVTVRNSKGQEILGACGQLAAKNVGAQGEAYFD